MIAFCDASALVKRYADEVGADRVRAIDTVMASDLALVEVPSALWRKSRMGELDVADVPILADRFRDDCLGWRRSIAMVALTPSILDRAVHLVARHPLRAYDAVQLSSAIAAAGADPSVRFACFDTTLSHAAAAEGLRAI